MSASDASLLQDARDTPAAFEQLMARHFSAIYRYSARRLGPDVAEDVTSEVFETAYRLRARYDTTQVDALPWLYGIATNVVRRHRKREAGLMRTAARAAAQEPRDGAAVVADELGPALAAALAKMRPKHRDALLLYALADLSYDQIAAALDVPVGTVRGWLNRARAVATRELAVHGIRPAGEPLTPTPEAEA